MAHAETDILNRWLLRWNRWGILFRNNTGCFLSLDGKRKIRAGLGKGTFDFIGWHTMTVTPEMVGKKIAVFTAVEGKTETGKLSDEQIIFLRNVRRAGGIAFVVRSEDTVPSGWGE